MAVDDGPLLIATDSTFTNIHSGEGVQAFILLATGIVGAYIRYTNLHVHQMQKLSKIKTATYSNLVKTQQKAGTCVPTRRAIYKLAYACIITLTPYQVDREFYS
eukprot:scaffold366279_cov17-Prasinocladus_malaysianus.AAC.1